MPSFQITIKPSRRAAARYVDDVRRTLLQALAAGKSEGVTQSKIAGQLGVHRSVINRELRGQKDITSGRVGELAWALGYRPVFRLERVTAAGANVAPLAPPEPVATSKTAGTATPSSPPIAGTRVSSPASYEMMT